MVERSKILSQEILSSNLASVHIAGEVEEDGTQRCRFCTAVIGRNMVKNGRRFRYQYPYNAPVVTFVFHRDPDESNVFLFSDIKFDSTQAEIDRYISAREHGMSVRSWCL
jgi:hypothetical protein